MRSPGVGGYFYPTTNHPNDAIWTAESLPSVIALTKLPPELGNPKFKPKPLSLDPVLAAEGDDYVIERLGARMRVHLDSRGADPPAVLLPFDRLFEVRVAGVLPLLGGVRGRARAPRAPAWRRRAV